MIQFFKIFGFTFLGGILGWLIWLSIYLSNKTPSIEFDGPAALGMIVASFLGAFIFLIFGTLRTLLKKPNNKD